MRHALPLAATLLALAACGDRPTAGQKAAQDRASHAAASAAMDAAFDKETGPAQPKPAAAEKPADKPRPKPAAEPPKPKPAQAAPVERGRPAWVDQLPSEPGKLFAVGGAPKGKRDDARTKAKQEIASSLKVHVQAVSTINEGEITRIGPGGERVGRAWSEFRNQARLSVDRELTFTRIVADADDGQNAWALAELDRAAWAAKLRQEIATVDAKLTAERDRLAASGGGLRAAAQTLRAIGPLAGRRDVLVSDLILAEPEAKTPDCPVDLQMMFAVCARNLATVTFKLENAPDAVFASGIQDAMARNGLLVNEAQGAFILRLALRETPGKLPNGWARVKVAGSATVVDPATGAVAGSLSIDESATDLDAANARAKMLTNACQALAREIDRQLIDLLGQ